METFLELALILGVAVIVGAVMQALKQPLIIGYIATGIAVALSGLVTAGDAIESFAHIGVVLLLFLVGLNLSPKTIKETGKVALYTGIGQVLFTSIVGFFIAWGLGFSTIEAIYLALGLTFSSTIIISKLLSDKGDLQTLYGRIAIGFLIVQDIVAIIVLMVLTGTESTTAFLTNLGFIAIAGIITLLLLPHITKYMAKSQELLLLYSVALCVAIAGAFQVAGLSIEAGALLAGIALSNSSYRHEIAARLKPLRDFFILMFFIVLGAQMNFASISELILPAIIFTAFILIGNPLIVMIIMGLLGYPKKAGFQAGLTVAQISEFSLILVALGVALGHINAALLSLATIVGIATIAGSTYLIMYSDKIYPHIRKYLSIFERKKTKHEGHEHKHELLLFGCNRLGFGIIESFSKLKKRFLIIDYDPKTIAKLETKGYDTHYGDAEDLELLEELAHEKIKMAISSVPKLETNLLLLNTLRQANKHVIFAVVAHTKDDALALYDAGASYVVLPQHLGGFHMGTLIERHGLNAERYLEEKIRHVEHLKGSRYS